MLFLMEDFIFYQRMSCVIQMLFFHCFRYVNTYIHDTSSRRNVLKTPIIYRVLYEDTHQSLFILFLIIFNLLRLYLYI